MIVLCENLNLFLCFVELKQFLKKKIKTKICQGCLEHDKNNKSRPESQTS